MGAVVEPKGHVLTRVITRFHDAPRCMQRKRRKPGRPGHLDSICLRVHTGKLCNSAENHPPRRHAPPPQVAWGVSTRPRIPTAIEAEPPPPRLDATTEPHPDQEPPGTEASQGRLNYAPRHSYSGTGPGPPAPPYGTPLPVHRRDHSEPWVHVRVQVSTFP